jgi:TetR/AcrR family transcriptional regulator, cholesterol catabolism regulator
VPPAPTRTRLRARYDARRRAVVDAAARLFAERGFHATSMADLVEATGLTAGGLYHYIGSKDALLVAICDELMEPLLDRARAIAADEDAPAVEVLRRLVREWTSHVERNRHHMLVFNQERHVLERGAQWREVRRQRKAFEELLAEVFERGARDGTLDFDDPGLAQRALLGMVNHTAQWLRPGGRLSAGQVADGYVDLLLGRG